MDKFLVPSKQNRGRLAKTAIRERAQQFSVTYEDVGKMFCRPRNSVKLHGRKSMAVDHIASTHHKKRVDT
jgi:hypothetical protein